MWERKEEGARPKRVGRYAGDVDKRLLCPKLFLPNSDWLVWESSPTPPLALSSATLYYKYSEADATHGSFLFSTGPLH